MSENAQAAAALAGLFLLIVILNIWGYWNG